MVKKSITKMRVWLVPYLMCPRALVLCLEEANFGVKFLTENYSKKRII